MQVRNENIFNLDDPYQNFLPDKPFFQNTRSSRILEF